MSSRFPRSRVLALATVTLLFACQDTSLTDPRADGGPGEEPAAAPAASGSLASLGRGLALALDDRAMRKQVLEAMRDSPFPEHSLHLQRYLASDEGQPLLERAAREVGTSPGALLGRVENRPDLQFFMPNSYQRGTWEGEGPVAVAATDALGDAVASGRVPAWTSTGEAVDIPLAERLLLPTLAVFPARHDFDADSTAELRGPQEARDRPTVGRKGALPLHGAGTPRDGAAEAELETAAIADGGGFAPGEGSLNDWMDWSSCRVASNDYDDDGLVNSCESALAQSFRPRLVFAAGEQLESRETYWAVRVQDFSERRVFIFYALSYHDDSGHIGDSEWIQLRIVFENGRWKLNYADYSAHFQGLNDKSATYGYWNLDFVGNRLRGRPVAYAADGKHANYNSISECDSHLDTIDDCNWGFAQAAGADATRNLGNNHGSTTVLEDCVGSEGSASDGHSTSFGMECYWTDRNFRGWHGTSTGAMPYGDVLAYFGWNTNPIDNDGDGSDSGDGDCDLRTARKRC